MTTVFNVEALGAHDRATFECGVAALDRYFREQVTQDIRRRAASCYVAFDAPSAKVAGYYTLAASGIPLTDIGPDLAKRLPRYPLVPAARLGRLAVDQAYRGLGLGSALLWDAASRALRSEVMAFALVVDAKDERAEEFYRHHGFINYGSLAKQLLLPLANVAKFLG